MNNVLTALKHASTYASSLLLATAIGIGTSFTCHAQSVAAGEYSLTPFESQFVASREGKPIGHARLIFNQLPNQLWQLEYESKVSKYFLTDKRSEVTRYLNTVAAEPTHLPLQPISYVYARTGTGKDKGLSITFDHADNQFLTSIPIDEEVQFALNKQFDNQFFRIDVPYQLSLGKRQFSYSFINYRGTSREYNISTVTTEIQRLPIGELQTIKVMIDRSASTRQTFAWFAPSLNYQLVRLQQFKDGKEQGDIQLRVFKNL